MSIPSLESAEETTTSRALEHFIRLARQGRHRGSSGGEKTALKLALVFLDGSSLDDLALDGLREFMNLAKSIGYDAAHDVIKGR